MSDKLNEDQMKSRRAIMGGECHMKPFGMQQIFSFWVACLLLFGAEGKAQESIKEEVRDQFIQENVTIPDKELSSMVIYRAVELKGRAINVYIGGEYQASLLPGSYTQAIVCPGNHYVVTAFTNPATRYNEKKKKGKKIGLKASVVSFFQVINHPVHGLTLLPLSKEEASSLFEENLPRRSHTISRLGRKKACLQPDLSSLAESNSVDLKKKHVSEKQNTDDPKRKYPQLGTHQIEVR